MIVLGMDTATPATAVALGLADGSLREARDDPAPGERPGHTTRLLMLADELLREAALGWDALERIAVGLGPGTFTGLRIGVATARGLAHSLGIELAGVSTLRLLAEHALRASPDQPVLALIDARRGEVFAAAYRRGQALLQPVQLLAPQVAAPEELASLIESLSDEPERERAHGGCLAVGDGALRYRADLPAADALVPSEDSPLHRVSAGVLCELAAAAPPAPSLEAIVPDYRRRPDAELALEAGAR